MLTVDERKVLLAPHLVNYGFVRELLKRDFTIIEVPVEEYWDLALNGVTLAPGKVVMNAGSPTVVQRARAARRRGDPGRLLGEPPLRDRRASTAPPSSSSATSPGRNGGAVSGRGSQAGVTSSAGLVVTRVRSDPSGRIVQISPPHVRDWHDAEKAIREPSGAHATDPMPLRVTTLWGSLPSACMT